MRISLGYPDRASERQLLNGHDRRDLVAALPALLTADELLTLQGQVLAGAHLLPRCWTTCGTWWPPPAQASGLSRA